MPDASEVVGKALNKLHIGAAVQKKQHDNGAPKTEPRFEIGLRKPVYPQPGQREPGPGKMPPKVAKLEFKDRPMRFFSADGSKHNVLRDLGFTGVINDKIIWTWGDTLMGTEEAHMICANDTTSIGSMKRPMTSCDSAMVDNHVKQWIPATEEEKKEGGIVRYGYGGTNVIEYAPNKGLVYYLKIDRKGKDGIIHGAGVAHVHMEGPTGMIPVATRVHTTLWGPKDPNYGDVGIAYNAQDKRVYAYGHGPVGDKEIVSRTFLCRAPATEAMNLKSYEYWDNEAKVWRKRRMTIDGSDGTIKLKQEHAIFDWYNMNQANPFWSNYFNKWMYIYGNCFGYSDVMVKTADKLEGPWHDHGTVAKTDPKPNDPFPKALRYCATGHPEFDPSGKTVLATWSKSNLTWGVVITWE